jgi:hypothetical protein
VDSWGGQADATIYDDSFGKQSREVTCTVKVIPSKCTPFCQPCDVYFYRQMKIFIKKVQHASDLLKEQREITSRVDAFKIHAIVHHQLSAPVFENMVKYAWFASKLTSNRSVFNNINEVCFPVTLTRKKCICNGVPFIKCSWCEVTLCLKCFYDRYHPKSCKNTIIKNVTSFSIVFFQ